MTHLEKLEKSVEATNLGEVLDVVAHRAEDQLVLLVHPGAHLLHVVLRVDCMPPTDEVNIAVVTDHNSEGVWLDSLVSILDDSSNFDGC